MDTKQVAKGFERGYNTKPKSYNRLTVLSGRGDTIHIVPKLAVLVVLLTSSLMAAVVPLSTRVELPRTGEENNYAEGYYFYLFDAAGTVFQGYININNYYPFSDLDSVVEYWIHRNGKILYKGHYEFEDDDLKIDRKSATLEIGPFRLHMGDSLSFDWQAKNDSGQIRLRPTAPGIRFEPPLIDSPAWRLSYPYAWGTVEVDLTAKDQRFHFTGYGSLSHYRSTKKLTKLFVRWQNMFLADSSGRGLFVTRLVNEQGKSRSGAALFDGHGGVQSVHGAIEPGRKAPHKASGHKVPDLWRIEGPGGECVINTAGKTVALSPLDEAGFFLRKIARIMFGNPWSWDTEATCTFARATTSTSRGGAVTGSTIWRGVLANDILK